MTKHNHIDTFIFDLDHTLYNADGIFEEMRGKMSMYIAKLFDIEIGAATEICLDLYLKYGTTLEGLMAEHSVDPHDFLEYTHAIDPSIIERCEDTAKMLSELPGRKLIYTNSPIELADSILAHLEIPHLFEGIFDIKAAELVPKPNKAPYLEFINRYDVNPETSIMFEDTAKNLVTADIVGFDTVWLSYGRELGDEHIAHVDEIYPTLRDWLDDYQKP